MTRAGLIAGLLLAALGGCDDMTDQPKQKVYAPLASPAQQRANTVHYDERPVAAPPVTLALLERGQQRFRIYCTPCHSELGDGHGMIVQRGFPPPPSYHTDTLRNAPVQHFYDVITNGHGAMQSFAERVPPPDRWAIAAYIRALQRSQNATPDDLTAEQRERHAMTARDRERAAWIAGGVGVVVLAIAAVFAPWSFPHAWLAALFCWLAWPLGSLALLLIHALTGGKWGWAIRPQLIAGIATLPLVLPFVLPLLFVLPSLYPWAQSAIQPHLPNGFYLNVPFFAVRGIVYLVVWLGLGGAVLWTLGREPSPLRQLAPPGLILLALTFTFAAIDLTLSMQPAFKSSVYGMLAGTEAVLFALSIAVLGVTLADAAKADAREDLGKLMLSLVILWAYLDFMQVLIVWQSDLPDEAAYYAPRISHGWQYVAGAIALLHFALPFFLLLWPQMQRSLPALRAIAAVLIVGEGLRAWWLVLPAAGRGIGIADVAAMLAAFGLAAGLALRAPRFPRSRVLRAMAEPEKVIPTAGRETADVSGRFILGAVGLVVGALACVIGGVMLAFPGTLQDKTMPRAMPSFPQPALQPSPRDDMTRFRAEQLQALNNAGWVDRQRGIAHIPIDTAMRLVAHDGIPGWPAR